VQTGARVAGALSLREIRYLLWPLPWRAEADTVRRSMTAVLVALEPTLERKGFVKSEMTPSENNRRARVYTLTASKWRRKQTSLPACHPPKRGVCAGPAAPAWGDTLERTLEKLLGKTSIEFIW